MAGMTTVVEPVRARFSEIVASMSARDRVLLLGLVGFGLLSLLGGGWWLGRSILSDLQGRIDDRESAVALLSGLASDQEEAAAEVARIEADLQKSADQDLPSFIEKAAEKNGISTNLQGVREKQVTTEGRLEEKSYTVEVTKLTLQQLTDFLYAVETGDYPLRVRTAKTRTTTVGGVKLLSLSLEISAFRLVEAVAPALEATP